ncbi:MAG: hypothetical protein ACD_75C02376G0001, partial [uncultured bacterium]
MTALNIAGKDDPGILRHDFPLMDMAQSPVVVALSPEIVHRAGGIFLMARAAGERSVEQSDIDTAGHSRRVACGKILGHRSGRITLAMDNHSQIVKPDRLGLLGCKKRHILRQGQVSGDLAGGIVVAGDDEDPDPGPQQASHPGSEEKTGVIVLPVAVIEIAGNKE